MILAARGRVDTGQFGHGERDAHVRDRRQDDTVYQSRGSTLKEG